MFYHHKESLISCILEAYRVLIVFMGMEKKETIVQIVYINLAIKPFIFL